ncbi:cache domain-containing protein, partial [Methanocalculus sp.]|uniref:cache domain-containing protein n=1 Tax=Methanocalculus sp. TaxID=2004547 RepID=UPI0027193505|nr:sodium:calcium antiporter [Methanocalculus sp.]
MRLRLTFLLIFLILFACIGGCVDETKQSDDVEMNRILQESILLINDEMNSLSEATEENAMVLSSKGLDDPDAMDSLRGWLRTFPYAISSIVIRSDGVVIAAVPEHYHQILGMDLSYQPAVQRANTIQENIVSDVFWLVEGFFGISQSSPIFSSDGEYLGYTDITYRPEMMIGHEITPILAKTSYDIWVTDTNGRVLYDTTAEEIGRNLFSDPAYQSPGLQEAFSAIVSGKSG